MATIIPPTSQGFTEAATALPNGTSNGVSNHVSNGVNGHTEATKSMTNGHAKPDYPKSRVELVDRFIDEPRKIRVAVVGGGLSGILAGILLPVKVPGIDLTIYEKNSEFGGTWLENVYPGVRCDIPSHVYQSTFSPNPNWSDQFAPGAEIRDYWQSVAKKYNVYEYAKFHHRVDDASWDSASGTWDLTITDLATNTVVHDKVDFVLTAIGRFNAWKLPDYPGLSDYKGILRHASHWDPDFDPTGKKVAVIGNGASGIQLVANLQRSVARLDHYARSKTWIAASWAGDERTLDAQPYTDEQKASFQNDPEAYLAFRKQMEDKYWRRFTTFLKGEANDNVRKLFEETMKARLSKKPEILEQILPDFSPNCRRLTPGPGYLEALQEDNVVFIREGIRRFTETGIETVDGTHREVDAIFCATGANGDMIPPFPIRAGDDGGKELSAVWSPEGEHGFPYTYLGAATPGFPNLFFVHGPHGTGPSGTVPHSVEAQVTYYAKFLRKASREGIKSLVPKKEAADDFVEYSDAFFSKTVLADGCSSWYNGGRPGARIHGLWPGSSLHVTTVRREPRWEDWEYEYVEESKGNRFLWYFGKGSAKVEGVDGSDITTYLDVPGKIDLRDLHESWYRVP